MKNILIILLLFIIAGCGSNNPVKKNITLDTLKIDSVYSESFVTKVQDVYLDSSAIVIPKNIKSSKTQITPLMFGAKANGITDDILAIEAATKYAIKNKVKLFFPAGTYRISRQWIIGYKVIQEADLHYYTLGDAPTWNTNIITTDQFPIEIEGSRGAIIFGDFKSKKETAIIYSCILSQWIKGTDFGISIKNLKILGRDTMHQIGLAMIHSMHSSLENVSVEGCKEGISIHSSYFSNFSNLILKKCVIGWKDLGSNGVNINNMHADYCGTGFVFKANTQVINNLTTEECETSAIFEGASQMKVTGVYFESTVKETITPLIIFKNSYQIDMNCLVLASAGKENIGRLQTGFYFDEKCKSISISNAALFGNIVTKCNDAEIKYLNLVQREGKKSK
jgi:hypothetical protein